MDLEDASKFPRGLIRLDEAECSSKEYTSNEFEELKNSLREHLASGSECSPLYVLVKPDEHLKLANDPKAAMAGESVPCELLVSILIISI